MTKNYLVFDQNGLHSPDGEITTDKNGLLVTPFDAKLTEELDKIHKYEKEYFCSEILKYRKLAGDGKPKWVNSVLLDCGSINPIINKDGSATLRYYGNLKVKVTEKKPKFPNLHKSISDERFKLLIKYAEGKELNPEEMRMLFTGRSDK